jgi:hypothetical protein
MFECGGLFVNTNGSIYQTASCSCTSVDLGGTVLTSPATDITYVAKFNSAGNVQWGLSMQGMMGDFPHIHPRFIQADALGNVYLAGNFTYETLGSSSVSAINGDKNFLAKLKSPDASLRADNRR